MSATAQPIDQAGGQAAIDRSWPALLVLWLALFFFLMSTAVGLGWDKRWHSTHVFNSFYSPPHLFIYTMLALTVLTVAGLMLSESTRREFGVADVRLPLLRRSIPGALGLCAAGLGVVMLAGLFDDIWHSRFGLDETNWSFPHAMLGTGFELTFMGILACRLALSDRRRITGIGWAVMGTLLLLFSADRVVGPLTQATPDLVRGIAAFPVLAIQPTIRHTMRIYEQWNLNRTNWLFVPAAGLATGMALGLVWSFTRREWVLVVAAVFPFITGLPAEVATAKYFGLQHDPRNWLPIPVVPAALVFVLARRLGAGERLAWAIAGVAFGLGCLLWDPHLVLVPVAVVTIVAGAELGRRMWAVVERPTARSITMLALVFGLGIPAVSGAVDLYLRMHTT